VVPGAARGRSGRMRIVATAISPLPYTKDVYETSFEWIAAHGIFPEGAMGSGSYEGATLSLNA